MTASRVCRLLAAAAVLILPSALAPSPASAAVQGRDGTLSSLPRTACLEAWVAYENATLTEQPGSLGPENPAADGDRLRFLQRVRTAGRLIQKDGHSYSLLVDARLDGSVADYLGWIRRDYLLTKREAMWVGESGTAERPKEADCGGSGGASGGADADRGGIHRKAMIVYPVETAKEALAKSRVVNLEVKPLSAPGPTADTRGNSLSLFNILFVYGETDEKDYLLVGSTEAIKDEDLREDVVLGWVPAGRVCGWDSRQALGWDRENTLPTANPRRPPAGKVYEKDSEAMAVRKARTAQADAQDRAAGATVKPLFREAERNGESAAIRYDRMRFPLLAWQPSDVAVAQPSGDANFGRLQRIGAVGGFVGAGGEDVSQADIEKLGRQAKSLKAEVGTTEIVFLIDDTSSMGGYFETVADVVKQIKATLDAKDSDEARERSVRIAVSYYHDYEGGGAAVEARPLRPIADAADAIEKELRAHQARDGGLPEERLFQGIVEAVETARFSTYARKLLIVIGDAGNRANGQPNDPALADAAAALVPEVGSPVELYAVQVNSRDAGPAARAFKTEMNALLADARRRRNARHAESGLPPADQSGFGGFLTDQDARQRTLGGPLVERYKRLRKNADEAQEQLDAILRGQTTGLQIDAGLKELLLDGQVDGRTLEILEKGGVQVFEYGYVWEKDGAGNRQVRKQALVNFTELTRLIDVLARLTAFGRDRSHPEDVFKKALDTLAGEPGRDGTQRQTETLATALGLDQDDLPKDSLLRRTVADLRAKPFDEEAFLRLAHRREVLEDIRDNLHHDYVRKPLTSIGKNLTRLVKNSESRRGERRSFTISDGALNWYWIDVESEMP